MERNNGTVYDPGSNDCCHLRRALTVVFQPHQLRTHPDPYRRGADGPADSLHRLRFRVCSSAASLRICWAAVFILDVIAGSVATLIAAFATYALRNKSKYLASVPPVVANALIIPWVLKYGYGEPLPIPFMMGTVALGEILTATIVGTILLLVLDRYRASIFKTA